MRALATIDQVGVAVHQTGCDERAVQVMFLHHPCAQRLRQRLAWSYPCELAAVDQQRTIVHQTPARIVRQCRHACIAPQLQARCGCHGSNLPSRR